MTVFELLQSDRPWQILAGVAGAAAMAATDWRTPLRLVQHIFVGTLCSAVATPWFAPAISKVLDIFPIQESMHQDAAAFITGAFAIYLLEFILAFWRAKIRGGNGDEKKP